MSDVSEGYLETYEVSATEQLAESFTEGGAWMYPIAALGCLLPLLALGFLVAGAMSRTNRALPLGLALLVLCVLPPALGVMGARSARIQVEAVINDVDEADRATIRAGAESELMSLNLWGLSSALIPSLLGCVLLGMGLGGLERFRPRPA